MRLCPVGVTARKLESDDIKRGQLKTCRVCVQERKRRSNYWVVIKHMNAEEIVIQQHEKGEFSEYKTARIALQ